MREDKPFSHALKRQGGLLCECTSGAGEAADQAGQRLRNSQKRNLPAAPAIYGSAHRIRREVSRRMQNLVPSPNPLATRCKAFATVRESFALNR
jgi:hypothetical protein